MATTNVIRAEAGFSARPLIATNPAIAADTTDKQRAKWVLRRIRGLFPGLNLDLWE